MVGKKELTRESITNAKKCKTVEELAVFAKESGVEMSAEEAKELFAKLHKTGELADDELDNVSGGGCSPYGDSCPICGNTRVVMKYIQETPTSPLREAWCCAGCGDFVCWRR